MNQPRGPDALRLEPPPPRPRLPASRRVVLTDDAVLLLSLDPSRPAVSRCRREDLDDEPTTVDGLLEDVPLRVAWRRSNDLPDFLAVDAFVVAAAARRSALTTPHDRTLGCPAFLWPGSSATWDLRVIADLDFGGRPGIVALAGRAGRKDLGTSFRLFSVVAGARGECWRTARIPPRRFRDEIRRGLAEGLS